MFPDKRASASQTRLHESGSSYVNGAPEDLSQEVVPGDWHSCLITDDPFIILHRPCIHLQQLIPLRTLLLPVTVLSSSFVLCF